MKYAIALLSLTLFSCASTPKPEVFEYECAIFGRHGVQAKMKGTSTSEIAAEREVEAIRVKLVQQGLVGENTAVMCYPANIAGE
jgi:hypothetical protein